jgi:hypothetical protein
VHVLKKLGLVAVAASAGMLLFGGMASAQEAGGHGGHGHPGHHGHDWSGQVGLVNVNNLDALHNVNGTLGLCGNDVNVLGVQVPIRNALNGIGVPILSPGGHEASSAAPYNCASGGIADGGSSQDN